MSEREARSETGAKQCVRETVSERETKSVRERLNERENE